MPALLPLSPSLLMSLQPVGKASSGSSFLPNLVTFPWYLHSCFISSIHFKLFCRRKGKAFVRLSPAFACYGFKSVCITPQECSHPVFASTLVLTQGHLRTDKIACKPSFGISLHPLLDPWITRATSLSLLALSAFMSVCLSHIHIQARLVAFVLVSAVLHWLQQEAQFRR